MAHAWKACWVKALGGSNPPFSAETHSITRFHHHGRGEGGPLVEITVVTVRPRRALLRSAFLSIVLAMIPVFGVLYWYSIVHDSWMPVLFLNLVVVILSGAALLRQLTVYSAVTSTELVGRGIFSPLVRVPLANIASVYLIATYAGNSPDTVTQLLVCDKTGHRLFRMRGTYWHPGDLKAVAAALPVHVTTVPDAISMDEFYRAYPGSAYWFEHRPILRIVVFAIGIAIALAITAWVMMVLGMSIGDSTT
jgi:hypothetical protein